MHQPRVKILHESRLILRREPHDDAFEAGRLYGVNLRHQTDRRASRPVLGNRLIHRNLFAGFVVGELDPKVTAFALGGRIMQHRQPAVGTMLERVFADLLAPRERVQTKIEDPGIRIARRALWINGKTAVIDHADWSESYGEWPVRP